MDHEWHERERHDNCDEGATGDGAQASFAADHPETGVAIFAAIRGMEWPTFRRTPAGAPDIGAMTFGTSLHGNFLIDATLTNLWSGRDVTLGRRRALYMTTSSCSGSPTVRRPTLLRRTMQKSENNQSSATDLSVFVRIVCRKSDKFPTPLACVFSFKMGCRDRWPALARWKPLPSGVGRFLTDNARSRAARPRQPRRRP